MVDVVDAATRSRMMAGIRSQDTTPEITIRKALHARGFRFSLHAKGMPGKPDIVLPKWKVVIFVQGCFWHWHGCRLSKLPASNRAFWKAKLAGNQERDVLAQLSLVAAGWRVAVIWECALRGKPAIEKLPATLNQIERWIRHQPGRAVLELSGLPAFVQVI